MSSYQSLHIILLVDFGHHHLFSSTNWFYGH